MFFKRFRKPRPTTDAEFVAAYKATGNLDVLGELYERHMDLVYAVCFNYLRDEADSQDAVMQLFEQLVVDLRQHEVTNVKSWLHTVARNHCLMHLRRQKTRVQQELTETHLNGHEGLLVWPPAAHTPEHEAQLDLDRHLGALPHALEQLPAPQQRCLDLFYLQQKSYAEVASLTGYDLKQVKSHLQNGRRNLKLLLQK